MNCSDTSGGGNLEQTFSSAYCLQKVAFPQANSSISDLPVASDSVETGSLFRSFILRSLLLTLGSFLSESRDIQLLGIYIKQSKVLSG